MNNSRVLQLKHLIKAANFVNERDSSKEVRIPISVEETELLLSVIELRGHLMPNYQATPEPCLSPKHPLQVEKIIFFSDINPEFKALTTMIIAYLGNDGSKREMVIPGPINKTTWSHMSQCSFVMQECECTGEITICW